MSVREYIGARYAPLFAEPIAWNNASEYEPLTIVLYGGDSYTSRQHVPVGIDIYNETYWVQTGNYNAQIQQYRSEVVGFTQGLEGEISARQAADAELAESIADETTARQAADASLAQDMLGHLSNETIARQAADAELSQEIEDETAARRTADNNLSQNIASEITARQGADNALSQSISDETTARQSADTALQNQIGTGFTPQSTVAQQLAQIRTEMSAKPLVLLIGDSWTEVGTYGDWLTPFKKALQVDVVNYGVGGSGWNYSPNANVKTFPQQLQYAATQMSDADKKRLLCILVMGGVNDQSANSRNTSNTISSILQGATSIATIRNSSFPNVPIYAALNLQSPYYQNDGSIASKMMNVIIELQHELPKYGIISLDWVAFSLYCVAGSPWDASNLHLSSTGAGVYASALIEAFHGGYNAVNSRYDPTTRAGNNGNFTAMRYTFNNGIFGVQVVRVSIDSGASENILTVPTTGWGWIGNVFHLVNQSAVNVSSLHNGNADQAGYVNLILGSSPQIKCARGGSTTGATTTYYAGMNLIDVINYS